MGSPSKVFPGRNRPRTTRGRPATTPYHPNLAKKAVRAYHEAETDMIDAKLAMDAAFVTMCKTGMLASQIAKATGLSVPGVYHIAGQLRQKVRNTREENPSTRAVVKRQADKKGGSLLFG